MYADAETAGAAPRSEAAGQAKQDVTTRGLWLRFLFMVLFWFVFCVLHGLLALMVGVQFLIVLFSGSPNQRLVKFGHELGIYYHDIIVFITFKTEARPFPFSDWRREHTGE